MSIFTEAEPDVPESSQVSILERVIPAASFGLASISGLVGAVLTISMFTQLREAENAGMEAIAGAMATVNSLMLGLLGLALLVGIGELITNIVRMSSDQPRSSPPGFTYLLAGLPNLVSPMLVAWSWSVIVEFLLGRGSGEPAEIGAWIAQILIVAVVAGIGSLILLPLFSFVPFRARSGKKFTSVAALTVVIIGIAAVAITLSGLESELLNAPRPTLNEAN
jgi:hypothetical protein